MSGGTTSASRGLPSPEPAASSRAAAVAQGNSRPTEPVPVTQPDSAPAGGVAAPPPPSGPAPSTDLEPVPAERHTRRARLILARVDPWSVMKLSFLLSIALAIGFLTAVFVLWTMLDRMGVFETANRLAGEIARGAGGESPFDFVGSLALSRVLGWAAILSVVNIVLLTALATLGAFLYNICSSLVGGLQVTLAEDV